MGDVNRGKRIILKWEHDRRKKNGRVSSIVQHIPDMHQGYFPQAYVKVHFSLDFALIQN